MAAGQGTGAAPFHQDLCERLAEGQRGGLCLLFHGSEICTVLFPMQTSPRDCPKKCEFYFFIPFWEMDTFNESQMMHEYSLLLFQTAQAIVDHGTVDRPQVVTDQRLRERVRSMSQVRDFWRRS